MHKTPHTRIEEHSKLQGQQLENSLQQSANLALTSCTYFGGLPVSPTQNSAVGLTIWTWFRACMISSMNEWVALVAIFWPCQYYLLYPVGVGRTEKAFERTMSQFLMTTEFAPSTQRFQLSAVPTLTDPRPMPFNSLLMELMQLTSSPGDISPRYNAYYQRLLYRIGDFRANCYSVDDVGIDTNEIGFQGRWFIDELLIRCL